MEHLLRALVLVCIAAAATVRAHAACDLVPGGEALVARVLDAETLALEDGRVVRLVGMISPRRPLWLAEDREWSAASAAKRALALVTQGRRVRLSFGGVETDRRGRLLAHLHVLGGAAAPDVWIQSAMIADGRGRVTSTRDNDACVTELIAVERQARAAQRGVWADPYYRIYGAAEVEEIARGVNQFRLVEGMVHAVETRGARTYVNFGEDWRTDFTMIVGGRDRRRFEAAGIDLGALAGTRVRVRGFVRNFNGPAIDVTHPGQVEILDAGARE